MSEGGSEVEGEGETERERERESVRGYICDSPLQFYMAYVMGLFRCYVPWSLVMVSVSCLMSFVACCGSGV